MTDEDSFTINGVQVTARMLAEARQELARRSPFNAGFYPAFSELTAHERQASEADARNYLRALIGLLHAASEKASPSDQGLGCSLHGGIVLGTNDGGSKWIDCSPEVCGWICPDHPEPLDKPARHICRPIRARETS